jgi:ribosome-associated protein
VQDEPVSKTRRKREMTELQSLGAALVELPESQLAAMQLEGALLQAVLEAKRIRSHEARRRQMQYIGKLMRDVDPEPIRAHLAALEGGSAQATAAHRRLEVWRERLMAEDEALTAFAAEHPGADVQKIRTLIRNSRKEQELGKPPRAYRELFRAIKALESSKPVPG